MGGTVSASAGAQLLIGGRTLDCVTLGANPVVTGLSITASITGASNTTLTFTNFQNAASGTVTTTAGTLTLNGGRHSAGGNCRTDGSLTLGGSFVFGDIGTLNRTGGSVNITGTL